MKKLLTAILLFFTVTALVGCTENKINDSSVNLYFYTFANALSDTSERPLIDTIEDIKTGTSIEEPEEPTRIGFDFTGWFTEYEASLINNQDKLFDFGQPITQTMMLYAGWLARPYHLSFKLNGGIFAPTVVVEYDEEDIPFIEFSVGDTTVLPRPERYGYSFVSWFDYDEYTWTENPTQSYRPGDKGNISLPKTLSKDTMFYAHWDPISVVISFNVNFPVSGGPAKPSSKSLKYNSEIAFPILNDATSTYTFMGWNELANGTGKFYTNGELSTEIRNKTVYAIWTLKN